MSPAKATKICANQSSLACAEDVNAPIANYCSDAASKVDQFMSIAVLEIGTQLE